MPVVSRLGVDIVGRDKTGQAFASVQQNVGKLSGSVGRLSSVLAGAGLGAFFTSAIKGAAELNVLSRRLGISVEDLSKFKFAAESTGSTLQQFVLTAQRTARKVDEINQGLTRGKTVANAFAQLSLDPAKLGLLSTADRFRAVVEASGKLTNNFGALAKIVDSEGIPVIRQLGGALADLESQAVDTSAVLSGELAQAAEDLTTQYSQLTQAVQTTAVKFLVGIPKTAGEFVASLFESANTLGAATAAYERAQFNLRRAIEGGGTDGSVISELFKQRDEAKKVLDAFTFVPASEIGRGGPAGGISEAEQRRLDAEEKARELARAKQLKADAAFLEAQARLAVSAQDRLTLDFENNVTRVAEAAANLGADPTAILEGLSQRYTEALDEVVTANDAAAAQSATFWEDNFFFRFEDGLDGLAGQFQGFLQNLANQLINSQIAKLFGSLFGGGGGGGSPGSAAFLQQILPGAASGLGGRVSPLGPSVFAGPDSQLLAVRARPNESVDIGGGGGRGGGVQISQTINVGGDVGSARDVANQVQAATLELIRRARRRGEL